MKFVLLKSSVMSCHEAHFAGGKHAFLCMARVLAAQGHEVHIFSLAAKELVMMYLMMNGHLGSMACSKASEGVVSWQEGPVVHHVAFSDLQEPDHLDLGGLSLDVKRRRACLAHVRLLDAASFISNQVHLPSLVIIDADESQDSSSEEQMSLFEAVVQRWGARVLPLVQNVHFLPFGPSGTSRRTQHLLGAWSAAGPVICVSSFVRRYLQQHGAGAGLVSERLWVVPLTTWQVFGAAAAAGDFPDFGALQLQQLQLGQLPRPVVGMLKLTPEKGAAVFAGCARALPSCSFLAVSGDPSAQQLQRDLPNVRVIAPQANIDSALQHMTLVLVPSLWLEAFGMVVVEALLRGVPVIVSDAGALPEASLGVAPVVHVDPIDIPLDPITSTPRWALRTYSKQDLSGWVQAIQRVLGDTREYERISREGRRLAMEFVQGGERELQNFLAKCMQLP